MRALLCSALLGLLGASCLAPLRYACADASQCQMDGEDGVCVAPGYCAYASTDCPSRLRYGPSASHLANDCVPLDATSSSVGDPTRGDEATTTDSTTGLGTATGNTDDCEAPCDAPPSSCFENAGTCIDGVCVYEPLPQGSACDGGEACVATACDGAGSCIATTTTNCEPLPGTCKAAGTCDPETGNCVFEPEPAGTPCDDGNACTIDDRCDAAGECVPGDVCPSDNPCEPGTCSEGTCTYATLDDGESCGSVPALRCCGGTCVDISTDDAHCGQCNFACATGMTCFSMAQRLPDDGSGTCTVDPAPSGRCECDATSQCTGRDGRASTNQVCRTFVPGARRCVPDHGSCLGVLHGATASCPGYCAYE